MESWVKSIHSVKTTCREYVVFPDPMITAENLTNHTAIDKLKGVGGKVVQDTSNMAMTQTVENTYKDSTSTVLTQNRLLNTPPSDAKASGEDSSKRIEGHPDAPTIQRYMRVRRYSYNKDGAKELIGEEEMVFDPKFNFPNPQSEMLINKLRNDGEKVVRRESVKSVANPIPSTTTITTYPNSTTQVVSAPIPQILNRPPVVSQPQIQEHTLTRQNPNSSSMPRLPPPTPPVPSTPPRIPPQEVISQPQQRIVHPPRPVEVKTTTTVVNRPPLPDLKPVVRRDLSPNVDSQFFNKDQYSGYAVGDVIEVCYLETDPGTIVEETLRKTENSVRREKRTVAINHEFNGIFSKKPLSLDLPIKNRPGKKLGDFVNKLPELPPNKISVEKSEIIPQRLPPQRAETPDRNYVSRERSVSTEAKETVNVAETPKPPVRQIVNPQPRENSRDPQTQVNYQTVTRTQITNQAQTRVEEKTIAPQTPSFRAENLSPPPSPKGPFQIEHTQRVHAAENYQQQPGALTFDSALSEQKNREIDFGFDQPPPPVQQQRPPPQVFQTKPPAQTYNPQPPPVQYQQAPPQNIQTKPPAQTYNPQPPPVQYQQAPPQNIQTKPPAQTYNQQPPPPVQYQQAPPQNIQTKPPAQTYNQQPPPPVQYQQAPPPSQQRPSPAPQPVAQPQPAPQPTKPKLQLVFKDIDGRRLPVAIENKDIDEREKRLILEDYLKREGLDRQMIDRVLSGKSINPEPQPVYVQRQERTEVSKFETQVPPQTRAPRKSNLQEFIEKNIESPPPPQRDLSPVGPGKPAHQQPVTTQVRPQQSMASALSEVNVVARGVASITRNESQQSSFFRDEAGSLDGYFKELPPLIGGNSQQTLPSQASRPPVIAQSIQQQNTYSQFSSQSGAPSYSREVYKNPSVSISRAAPANPSYVSHQASNQMSYRVSNQESFGAERSAVRNQRDSKEGSLEFEKKITSNDSSLSVDPNSHREMTNQVYQVTPPTRPMDFKPAPVQSTTTTTSRTQTITQNRSQSPPSKPLAKLPSTKKAQIRMKKDMVAHSHLNQITEEDDENRSQYRQYEEDDEDDFMEDDQSISPPRYQQGPIVVEVEKPKNESYSQFDDYNYADNRREFGLESEIPNLMPDQYIVRGGLPGRGGYEASRVQSGSSQVQSGISRVQSGASQIQSGTSRFQPGPSQIQTGASRVQPGLSQMQSGTTLLQPVGANPTRMQFESQIKESNISSINRSQAQGGFGASAFGAFDDSVQEQSFAQSRANYGTNQTGESRVIENTSQFGFNTPSPRGNAGSRQQSSLNYTEGSQKSSLNHGSEESKKYNAGYNQSSYSQNEDQYTSQYLGNDQNQGRNQKNSRIANSNVSGMNRAPVGFSAFGSVQSVEISKLVANERFW